MRALVRLLLTVAFLAAGNAWSQQAAGSSPSAGFDLHSVAPHIPTGRVTVARAVGHRPLGESEYASQAPASPAE